MQVSMFLSIKCGAGRVGYGEVRTRRLLDVGEGLTPRLLDTWRVPVEVIRSLRLG